MSVEDVSVHQPRDRSKSGQLTLPQFGIFAQGTHAHRFLEFDVKPGVTADQALVAFRELRAPNVSAGGVNFVLAFGADLWRAVAPSMAPDDVGPFGPIAGRDGNHAPPTQHDAWLWISGAEPDVTWQSARARCVPYGTASEHGLYFLAFSAARPRYDLLLARMFGTASDGIRDRLTDLSRPVTGAYYFAPSLNALGELAGPE